ncbi:hemolysin family protein [Clostridium sp. MB40-C1]|uniref:hemolysin family protein n=1 Tax=Clostridium sp. MB40-C1 TaxID=3070996 RepID=UPI0027E149C6|nr:hemolysin family protein [Clostridium sp. MB40-C1]WMJ80419.1 hemolysin family protein [Clostridium sp. MB40-C1]
MDVTPTSSILPQIILVFILILINAFFAASEMAIVSLNKNKVILLAKEGNKKAQSLQKLTHEPSKFLATIQVGITISGLLASASAATSISSKLSLIMKKWNIPYSDKLSILIITIILSYITLVFGELLPKRIALQNSESIAMFVVNPILFISKITLPFVKLLSSSTNLLVRLAGLDTSDLEEKVSKEEIKSLIDVGEEHGVINETEREMINGIFDFDDKIAKEVMTPRTDVFAVDIDDPINKTIKDIVIEQFSRVPIYKDDSDNIIGILYIKDLFQELLEKGIQNINLKTLLKPAYFVPETKNIDDLFKELQSSKTHMAILIDEYGGFSGIVTIEDLIEEITGNIFDEHDEIKSDIKKLDNNTYIVNGIMPIDDLNDSLHLKLESENSDTIGGFVIDLLGSIPKNDEEKTVDYDNIIFKIEKVSEKRIEKLKIYIPSKE